MNLEVGIFIKCYFVVKLHGLNLKSHTSYGFPVLFFCSIVLSIFFNLLEQIYFLFIFGLNIIDTFNNPCLIETIDSNDSN